MTEVVRENSGPLLALELLALSAFAFARPVLDSFGRSPETFIARQASTTDIVLFGVAVLVLPALAAVVAGILAGLGGRRARWLAHVGLVAVLAGVGVWRLGQDQTNQPGTATRIVALGVLAAVMLGLLRWMPRTRRTTATFLRFAGVASIVFLGQFLLTSPTGDLAFGEAATVDSEVADEVTLALGDDPPPVLFVVFDGVWTGALLDGSGGIDAELYSNFAALTEDATWYRNNTTVAAFTQQAVPAILTGRHAEGDGSDRSRERDNLFTLLGGSYDLQVKEQITQLCPPELCSHEGSAGVGRLLADAAEWWRGTSATPADEVGYDLPGALGEDRYEVAEEWIAELDVPGSGVGPDLYFLHVVLPHAPYQFSDDGAFYVAPGRLPTGAFGLGWTGAGIDVGRQRYLLQLQASDRLLGQLLDGLRAAGIYDDALVVVTADHGEAFTPDDFRRQLSAGNLAEIAWAPLLVKTPHQTEGVVNDDNLMSIDIVPTVADVLGVDIPWEVHGIPADRVPSERDLHLKLFEDDDRNDLGAPEGEMFVEIDARDHFEGVMANDPVAVAGTDAIWKLTAHGELFGRSVADLTVGDPAGVALAVESPDGYDGIDLDQPLPLEVVASADLDVGAVVAFALNGTVGALGEVQDLDQGIGKLVHGLIPPRLFVGGDNQLTAYLVEGPVGDEILRPLDVGF